MKLKRNIALMLTAVITVMCLAGCGGKNREMGEINTNLEGEFTPEKDLELVVWNSQGNDYVAPDQPKKNIVEDWLIDNTRVKIVSAFGNGEGTWEAKLSRLIAGDNFPDLFVCGGGQGPTHFTKLAEAERIWELTPEVLNTYAPNVMKNVPEEWWDRIKVDGKIYGIPYGKTGGYIKAEDMTEKQRKFKYTGSSDASYFFMIRDDILKKFYPEAKTMKELEEICKTENRSVVDDLLDSFCLNSLDEFVELAYNIRALDLKEGNKPVYAYGYMHNADAWVPLMEMADFMTNRVGHFYPCHWNTKTEKMEMPLLSDWLRENMKLQNKMIRDDVVDPESLMQTDAQYKEKALNGQYAMIAPGYVTDQTQFFEQIKSRGTKYGYVPVYIRQEIPEGYDRVYQQSSWLNTISILNTVSADDVPQVLNWIDKQFTEEYADVYYWGPKSAGMYEEKDGKRLYKDDRLNRLWINRESGISITLNEKMGVYQIPGLYALSPSYVDATDYRPDIYNDVKVYTLTSGGYSFTADSKYLVEPVEVPPMNIWDAEYANLETVKTFWNARTAWEEPFRLTLTAQSEEEFEKRWKEAVDNVKSIVDVDEMMSEMTKIAKEKIKK